MFLNLIREFDKIRLQISFHECYFAPFWCTFPFFTEPKEAEPEPEEEQIFYNIEVGFHLSLDHYKIFHLGKLMFVAKLRLHNKPTAWES